jgi:hypothetical protein
MTAERRQLWLALAGGLAVFLAGAALALAFLPEWRAGQPAGPALYEREFRRIAAGSGLSLAPGRPPAGSRPGVTASWSGYARACSGRARGRPRS